MMTQFYQRFFEIAILNYWIAGYILLWEMNNNFNSAHSAGQTVRKAARRQARDFKPKVVIGMKQNIRSMECAGSLTPELEGAARTSAHPRRQQPARQTPPPKKGGTAHE